MINNTRVN